MVFESGTFSLGVNYWASHAATRMWSEWDEEVVRQDLAHLAGIGCTLLRVFPLWPDFQPIMTLRTNCFKGGYPRGYAFVGERPIPDTEAGRAGVDETMMARFRTLADIAASNGLKLIVPLLNGHMTFRIYAPPAVDGLDHFRNPESLMWQGKFVRYFVRTMKDHPAILAWELGNECNCLGAAESRAEAWSWTAFVSDAIRSQDPGRPVFSGMHSLVLHDNQWNLSKSCWTIADQSELSDALTAHPYAMWRNYINCDPAGTLRWILLPVTANRIFADIGGKPSFVEEVGTLRRTFSTFETLGNQLRSTLWLLWAADARALLWWCAFDQTKMEFSPYDWDEPGMEHGALTTDYRLNPTGRAIAEFAKFLQGCPVKRLPPARTRAVCILGRDQPLEELVNSIGLLAAQAGFAPRFAFSESAIPESPVYLVPCAVRKAGLNRKAWRELLRRVEEDGATLYFSLEDNACFTEMAETLGFEIAGRGENNAPVALRIGDLPEFELTPKFLHRIEAHGAVPLDPEGIVWEFRRGRGRIVTALLPLELLMLGEAGSYQRKPAWAFYRYLAGALVREDILESPDCEVLVSEHPESETICHAIVCNCSPEDRTIALKRNPDWKITAVRSEGGDVVFEGEALRLPANSGALLTLEKA